MKDLPPYSKEGRPREMTFQPELISTHLVVERIEAAFAKIRKVRLIEGTITGKYVSSAVV